MASIAIAVVFAVAAALAGPPARAAIDVRDDTGAAVKLPRPAQRIVSLAPSITELLFAIGVGERVIGTSGYSDFPPQARDIPVVGGPEGLDLERIASLHPDLVVLWGSGYPPSTRKALGRLGVPVFVSEPESFDAIANAMEQLGELTAAPGAAGEAARFRARLAQLRQRYRNRRPMRVFYQVWAQPLMTLSSRHVVSEALQLCGASNVFSAQQALVPTVSPEAVIAADPQLIFATEPGARDRGALQFWSRYPFVSAVANGRLLTLDADRIDRATPRMLDEVQRMCELIDAARDDPPPAPR
jgi:iron complex transport system substrate-binding protein